jgi:hypothetical protein
MRATICRVAEKSKAYCQRTKLRQVLFLERPLEGSPVAEYSHFDAVCVSDSGDENRVNSNPLTFRDQAANLRASSGAAFPLGSISLRFCPVDTVDKELNASVEKRPPESVIDNSEIEKG